jgi:hypothetical protein
MRGGHDGVSLLLLAPAEIDRLLKKSGFFSMKTSQSVLCRTNDHIPLREKDLLLTLGDFDFS